MSEKNSNNISLLRRDHAGLGNFNTGFCHLASVKKTGANISGRHANCEPESEPNYSHRARLNHAGERPIAIIADEKSGRERAVYPGQSADAVAQRFGFKDYTVEVLA